MVNRGWVPQGSEGPALPGGAAAIEGQIQNFPSPNVFTPDNPRSGRDWYRLNRKAAQGLIKSDIEMAPLILRATEGNMPDTKATTPQIPNNHAAYAAFWFWMASILAVIFFLRFIRKPA
jgi:cytochrome oxidase assembly protein ShyY1